MARSILSARLNNPPPLLGWLLLWAVYVFGVIGCLCAVLLLFNKNTDGLYRMLFPLGYFWMLVSYAVYCFSNPFISAVNFRYIPTILIYECGAIWIVLSQAEHLGRRILRWLMLLCVVAISVETTILYLCYI